MNWRLEFSQDYYKNMDFLILSLCFIAIFSLVINRPILFLVIGLFIAYIVLNRIYDYFVGKQLTLKNNREKIRLFPDETDELHFTFVNRSPIPYVNGTLRFQMDDTIFLKNHVASNEIKDHTYEIPLSVLSRRETKVNLPIKALHRGVGKIKNIQYDVPHLFNFTKFSLIYDQFYNVEYIVFPKRLPVINVEQMVGYLPGEERTNFSPYEDALSPLGTRDYSYSDPFQKINWKATAKVQKLQTNVYERVIDQSFLFIVNLASSDDHETLKTSPLMEDYLSYMAYLSEYVTKEKLPYELAINAQRLGDVPYVYLPLSEGNSHYLQTLETIARIHRLTSNFSFVHMLYRLRQRAMAISTIVVVGEIPQDAKIILKQWQQKGKAIFQVVVKDNIAKMIPLSMGGMADD